MIYYKMRTYKSCTGCILRKTNKGKNTFNFIVVKERNAPLLNGCKIGCSCGGQLKHWEPISKLEAALYGL